MGMEVLIIFITQKDAAFPIYLYIFQFQDFHFLCPNDTVFDQQHLVCSNWFDVDCQRSTQVWIIISIRYIPPPAIVFLYHLHMQHLPSHDTSINHYFSCGLYVLQILMIMVLNYFSVFPARFCFWQPVTQWLRIWHRLWYRVPKLWWQQWWYQLP